MATIAEIAADDLRKKLRLERVFLPECRKLFRAQAEEYRRYVARHGSSPGAGSYRDDWEAALRVQFRRAQKAFRGDVALMSGAKSWAWWSAKADLTPEEEAQLEDLTDEALDAWAVDKSQEDAEIISATTDRDMRDALDQARTDSEDKDLPSIAALAATYLLRKLMARAPTIATTETQVAAEATKHTVAEAMAGKVPAALTARRNRPAGPQPVYRAVGPERQTTKTWVTQGDSRVRPTHVAANRQRVLNDQTFSVGGYRLRFPGDGFFGAPASIICNCRCMSVYSIGEAVVNVTTPEPAQERVVSVSVTTPQPEKPLTTPAPKPQPKPDAGVAVTAEPKPTTPKPNAAPLKKPAPPAGEDLTAEPKPPTVKPPKTTEITANAGDQKIKASDFELKKKITATEKSYLEWYTGDGFRELNNYMRDPLKYAGSQSKVDSLNRFRDSVQSSISKVKTTRDLTVYRGVDNSEFKRALASGELKALDAVGFQSTSAKVSVAESFGGKYGVLMRIKVPKGTSALPVSSVSNNTHESEILLGHGGRYRIVSVSEEEIVKGVKRVVADLEYIE